MDLPKSHIQNLVVLSCFGLSVVVTTITTSRLISKPILTNQTYAKDDTNIQTTTQLTNFHLPRSMHRGKTISHEVKRYDPEVSHEEVKDKNVESSTETELENKVEENPEPEPDLNPLTILTNEYRSKHNKPALKERDDLCLAVKERLKEVKFDFSHEGFNRRVKSGEYQNLLHYEKIGENLWKGTYPDLPPVIDGWANSPSHNENMLGDYEFGCAIREDEVAAALYMN